MILLLRPKRLRQVPPAQAPAPRSARRHEGADADEVMKRLADLWAKLAQLDPEVARRLPTYEA